MMTDGQSTLARRIIPCLDVRDGSVVKGVRFAGHRIVGDIVERARHYRDEGADELVFYDITASPEGRSVDRSWVEKVAREIDIPFCVAGGIESVEIARKVLFAGADKISVNTPALLDPDLIARLADAFGSQCVVVGIDSIFSEGEWRVKRYTGEPAKTEWAGTTTMEWISRVQELGAGEIVLNCIASDGVREGYDLEQLAAARRCTRVPLIASGGAGQISHFVEVFESCDVDGALAASVFHSDQIAIRELKAELQNEGIEVRCE